MAETKRLWCLSILFVAVECLLYNQQLLTITFNTFNRKYITILLSKNVHKLFFLQKSGQRSFYFIKNMIPIYQD